MNKIIFLHLLSLCVFTLKAGDFSFPETEADHYVSELEFEDIVWKEDPKHPEWRWKWFDGYFLTLYDQTIDTRATFKSLGSYSPIIGLEYEKFQTFEEKLGFYVSVVANITQMPKESSIPAKTLFRCTAKLTDKSMRLVGKKIGLKKDFISQILQIKLGSSESQEKSLGSELYYVSPVLYVPESFRLPDGDEGSFFGVNHVKAICNKHFEGRDVAKEILDRLEFVQKALKGAITCNLDKNGKGKDRECQEENVSGLTKLDGYVRQCIPVNDEAGTCQYRLAEKSICHHEGKSSDMLAKCGKNMVCDYDQKLSEFIRSKYILPEPNMSNMGQIKDQGYFLSKHYMVTVNFNDEFGYCRPKMEAEVRGAKSFCNQNPKEKGCLYLTDKRWDFHYFFRELVRLTAGLKKLELNSSTPLEQRKIKMEEIAKAPESSL